jgi:hypothetical protein
MGVLVAQDERAEPYRLSIEGLDNHPGVADQRERLEASLRFLRSFLVGAPPAQPAGAVR